jgi:hypothetical protein
MFDAQRIQAGLQNVNQRMTKRQPARWSPAVDFAGVYSSEGIPLRRSMTRLRVRSPNPQDS